MYSIFVIGLLLNVMFENDYLVHYQLTAMKHTYQLRGMASTLRMRTTISPGQ